MDLLMEMYPLVPSIKFIGATGEFEIRGRSIPVDAASFYMPILKWLRIYCISPAKTTHLVIQLESYNESSRMYLLELISILENSRSDLKVEWIKETEEDE